jgi:2-keto-myo-inositol isomerase
LNFFLNQPDNLKKVGGFMAKQVSFALNHIVAPYRKFSDFLRLTQDVGVSSVEIRNDLRDVEIADGTPAAELRKAAEAGGFTILTINALQRFNDWNPTRAEEATALARYAHDCGAQALVMCPVNSREDRRSEQQRLDDLHTALRALMPILRDNGLTGLVEPLGFEECSLRYKRVAVDAIDEIGGQSVFKLVHDTFHHYLAGETEFFPDRTGLVHISGVVDTTLAHNDIRDQHRILVGPGDLLGNLAQIRTLLAGGYQGPLSFEPFAESVHRMEDIAGALRESMALIRAETAA